ncbi:MAG: BMP family ABC transporter substrate-binding protein [Nitriliruptoraceae bacterium]
MRKTTQRVLAMIAAGALVLVACGDDGDEAADFRACLVTDEGGVDDASFNETAFNGLVRARDELGIDIAYLESSSETDYEPNVQAFLDQDCGIIITVGFLLGETTEQAAINNPDQLFAIVDYAYDANYDNLRELVFATEEAAFLAGYVAAATTETGVLGTYGGINIPPVTVFMDGYLAGARYHNAEHGTDVQVLGWDGSDGLFTGNFDSLDDGRNVTDDLLQAGADIILPVAGPVGRGSLTAIEDFGSGLVIWVDTDGTMTVPQQASLLLTSIMKNMDVAVFESVQGAFEGSFQSGLYVGTLANGGVGIAPYYDNEDRVPQQARDRVSELTDAIIAGELSVSPADH